MAKFIKVSGDPSFGKVVMYVNVDQVAMAKYHADDKFLEITVSGISETIELRDNEALVAVKLLEQFA